MCRFYHVKFNSNLLRVIFWVVPRRMVFNNRRFGTLCLFHLHRRVGIKCVKLERRKLWRQVQAGLVLREGEGLFTGSSPVVDTSDRCVGQVNTFSPAPFSKF
jgi:hypothetical protein